MAPHSGPKDCTVFEPLLPDYAHGVFGGPSELAPDETARVEAHLAGCQSCRERVREMAAALERLASSVEEIELPAEVLERSEEKIRKAVEHEMSHHQIDRGEGLETSALIAAQDPSQNLDHKALPLSAQSREPVPWFQLAAAAVLLAVAGMLFLLPKDAGDGRAAMAEQSWAAGNGAEIAADRSEAPVGTGGSGFALAAVETPGRVGDESGGLALKSGSGAPASKGDTPSPVPPLTNEFAQWKEVFESEGFEQLPIGTIRQAVEGAEAFAAKQDAGTYESVCAMEWLAKGYTQLGESEKARDTYFAFAEAQGERTRRDLMACGCEESDADARGRKVTEQLLLREIRRRALTGDGLEALAYCDRLLTRYAKGPAMVAARREVARYFSSIGATGEAIKSYEALLAEGRDAAPSSFTYTELALAYRRAGRYEDAARTYHAMAAAFEEPSERAYAHYSLGKMWGSLGGPYLPNAVRELRLVRETYGHVGQYGPKADAALAKLQASLMDDLEL